MDLNVKYKTIKPLGENIEGLGLVKKILDMISKAQSKKKLNFVKVKNLCSVSDPLKMRKKQAADWAEIAENHVSSNDSHLAYIKN